MTDKLSLTNLANLQNETTAVNAINSNNAAIITAVNNTLSRDGTSPNTMSAPLDMNNQNILNLPSPATAGSPVRLQDVVSPATIASVPPVGTSGGVVPLLNGNNTWSGTNTWSNINTFTQQGYSLNTNSTAATAAVASIRSTFNSLLYSVASQTGTYGGTAILGAAIQDKSDTGSFPCGVAGYSTIVGNGTGNYAFGVFGRADLPSGITGSICNELDVNNQNADSPAVFPPALSPYPLASSYAIGLQLVNIGKFKAHSGIRLVASGQEGGIIAPFRAGIYSDPSATSDYGIFLDATSSLGPTTGALIRNTGSTISLSLETVGAGTPTNTIFQTVVNSGVKWNLLQEGSVLVTSTKVGNLQYSIDNTDTGAASASSFLGITNAGFILLQADTTAGGSSGALRWTGSGSLLIDALNAAGTIQLRAGVTPTIALTVLSTGVLQLGAPSTTANGSVATALSSVGPAGSHTTVQEWIQIQNSSGVVRYIPCF